MLCDLIKRAQRGDEDAMLKLIERFRPLFRKYAIKLNYEDAYEDIILFFVEFVHTVHLNDMSSLKDEILVSYINISVINFYNKKIHKVIEAKKEIPMSDLTEEQLYYAEVRLAKEDETDIFAELGLGDKLNQNECKIMYMVYVEGYTIAEIARRTKKTRQAVNQQKHRALNKLKQLFNKHSD